MWTGIAARTTVFVYNTELLAEADLPDVDARSRRARVAGPLGRGAGGRRLPGDRLGAARSCAAPRRPAHWLAGLKRNALAYRGNFEAMRGANVGEVDGRADLPLLLLRRPARHRRELGQARRCTTSATRIRAPSSRSRAAACWRPSSHPDAAQAFLAFVTGPEGQAILRDGNSFEYPIGSGVEANPALPPLDDARLSEGRSLAAQRRRRSSQLMTAAGVM